MRTTLLALFCFIFPLSTLACGNGLSEPAQPQAREEAQAEPAEETATEPVEEVPEPQTEEERQAYIEKVENELKQIDDRIIELKDLAARGGTATAEQSKKAIKELDEKRKAAQEKLTAFKDATKSAGEKGWDATKKGTDKAVDELKKTYKRVKDIF